MEQQLQARNIRWKPQGKNNLEILSLTLPCEITLTEMYVPIINVIIFSMYNLISDLRVAMRAWICLNRKMIMKVMVNFL